MASSSSFAYLRRADLLTLCHLRTDGRKPNELRKISIQLSPLSHSNHVSGSALFSMGLTMALAVVSGPMDCPRKSDELPDRLVFMMHAIFRFYFQLILSLIDEYNR